MKIIDLSHTIHSGMAQYPDDPGIPQIKHVMTHEKNDLLASALELSCHVGTHIDIPYHFLKEQPSLEKMPLEVFFGKGRVVDAPATDPPAEISFAVLNGTDFKGVDYLIIRTGWEQHWGTPRYYQTWPFLSSDLAKRLAESKLKGVGLDTPSADPLGGRIIHDLFAEARMINVENLANLSALPEVIFDLMVLPLKLAGAEASPVRAVALI
jgi:kynurenine formamidase